ncbi:MAG: peptide chain release factor N(5)-glutamine methyltransferase [Patescibacteria group bacterium]|nr:peptide chain release factor N(5)-glutamine methyltransferase [Patescibacteria group bacterium]
MKINELLKFAYEILKNNGIDFFILDSEILLGFVLKKNREWILANPNFIIHKKAEKRFFRLLSRRVKNYPIAYILGYKYFYGLKFGVNKNVLIPRPETEILVDTTCEVVNLRGGQPSRLTILDIGTGSGCIAIALAKKLENVKIIASDISQKALRIAKKNAKINKVNNIEFIKSDLLKNIENKKIDIITANLPYIKQNYNHDSIKYEPRSALYSYSKNGLSYYKKLLYQIEKLGFNPKYIFLEIDPDQAPILKTFIEQIFKKSIIEIKKDLNNLDRVFMVKFII